MGLPHLGIEALIAMTNKLIMHYGCNTATGKLMQTSYSLFYVEAGLSFHLLQESYACYGGLVMHSWMKMLWEKLSALNVKLVIADGAQTYPRENNQFIMQVLISKGYSGETLRRLNRVRVSQQVLFMSDILTASGNKIDINAGIQRAEEDSRLELRWPKEQPTESDFQLWRNALQMICPSKSRALTVGKFKTRTH